MSLKERIVKIIENNPELVMRAVVQIILATGLVVAAMILAVNMEPVALMQLSKSSDDCAIKAIDMTNRLHIVSDYLQGYSKRLDEMTNGLEKVEFLLRTIEQRSSVLKVEDRCNCWCPCCLWKVGCQ